MSANCTYVQGIAALGTGRSNYGDGFIVHSISLDDQLFTCYFSCCLGIGKILVTHRAVPVFLHAVIFAGNFNGSEISQSVFMIADLYVTRGQYVAQEIAFCNDNAMQLMSNVFRTDLIGAFGCTKNCNTVQIPLIVELENFTIKIFNYYRCNSVLRGRTGELSTSC